MISFQILEATCGNRVGDGERGDEGTAKLGQVLGDGESVLLEDMRGEALLWDAASRLPYSTKQPNQCQFMIITLQLRLPNCRKTTKIFWQIVSKFSAMVEVGSEFILAPEHRPKLETVKAENIPLIDLSASNSDSVAEIGNACKNWGFFQVINHGVPSNCHQKIESASRKFFSLPKEEKEELSRDEFNPYGYYDTEHTKNVWDWKEIFECTSQNPVVLPSSHHPEDTEVREFRNKWPRNLPELRQAVEEYATEVEKLAFKLLELVSMSLGLRKDRFIPFFNVQTSRVKLNYYPPCPHPHLALGTGRHKDGGALTILAQDEVGGLQVKRQTDGEWILVKPNRDAFIVNVGDMIQVWSNEKYKSIEHRAMVNSEKERLSIPFFFNPAHHTWIEPLEELVNEANPPRYRVYNWGKFIVTQNRGNFKKLDVKNLQISDFRI